MIHHPSGDYSFVPGIAPYSCGVISKLGYEIVSVTLRALIDWRSGFDLIDTLLRKEQRARTSLCAVSLRSPEPFTFDGFAAFNADYAAVLKKWGVFVDGVNPIARTNIVPETRPSQVPSLSGFAFTRPCRSELPPTFVVAGAGELPEGILNRDSIYRLGDLSADGLVDKARFVTNLMSSRLIQLGTGWAAVTRTNVYTIHSMDRIISEVLEPQTDLASRHGFNWFYSRPPIEGIEYEMDVRGVRTEWVIEADFQRASLSG
ncbi:MAG: RidA family protein [Planctomycetota bacterium]